jgi:MFS family permease
VVDLNLFKNRLFSVGNISLAIMVMTLSAQIFLMPFYLINGVGYSASTSGLLLATSSVLTLVIGPLAGWLSDKVGSRLLCSVGFILACLSLFLLSHLGTESSTADIILRLAVFGVGVGLFMSPNISMVMGAVPRDSLGGASALSATIRQMGMSIGMAIAGSIFTSRQLFHASQLAQSGLDSLMLDKLSLIGGYKDTILVAAITCCIGIFTFLIRAPKQSNQ